MVAVIGGGPAGLMAAEILGSEVSVDLYDAMPSDGRHPADQSPDGRYVRLSVSTY